MKRSTLIKLSFATVLLPAILVMDGCKKEAAIKQEAPVTIVGTEADSAVYLKGYFDGQPVKFEGSAVAYNGFVDPDSAFNQGGGGGQNQDQDAFYQSGSKWMMLSSGQLTTGASVELRSLAVRVFVSPVEPVSNIFYNLLSPANYPVADDDGSGNGAYISLHDKNGVLWTSHGDQDGSSMTIVSRGANMGTYTIVSGTVTAKLYDGEHNMKKLTAASFTAALGI